MATTVPEMRSNKPGSMDIDQLRAWAAFADKAMIASLIVTVVAVVALGVSAWLSSRFNGAVRAHELSALERDSESQSAQLEQEVSMARARAAALEQEVSTARGRATSLEQEVSTTRGRTAALEQEVSAARERLVALERDAAAARERAAAFEQAAREANERAARVSRESAAARQAVADDGDRTPLIDAAEIQRRLADLGKLVRGAAGGTADPAQASATEADGKGETTAPDAAATGHEAQRSPVVASLGRFADTKAAILIVDQISGAPQAASTISGYLGDAGWEAQTWTWKGVAGIFGVVVLVRDGSPPATLEAASALLDALRSAGFEVTKGDWPADWRRHRGTFDGPQSPAPTDAPIRIVIGAKPR
ncbi:MAG: hypothetical protein ACOY4R_26365 [Pseudomonadota bacterium]